MKKYVITYLLLLLVIFSLNAQNSEEITIEEIYLQNVEIGIIKEQALSESRDIKLLALDNLEEMMSKGKVAKGAPEAHLILDVLSKEGVQTEIRENRRLTNYYPEVRRRSCQLLGELGGAAAKSTLINVLLTDDETMVLSEAAYAMGQIGDADQDIVSAMAAVVFNQDPTSPDNNLAFAVLLGYEKLAVKNTGLSDPEAIRAIIFISQGNYLRNVKLKANRVLETLGSYN